jgi:hypothetical protein
MKLFVKLITLAGLVLFIGCTSSKQSSEQIPQGMIFSSSFNEENYVWESFMFPTNRTDR